MHILFHTQYFPPEIGAPQARISEMARRLYEKGAKVTVLTAMPNYPTGKIYPGYSGFFRKERLDYATVYRTFICPGTGYGFVKRLVNYFSFVFSSLLLGCLKVPKPDVIITESTPLFLGIAGFLLSRRFRAKWVFNISDLWPKSALDMGIISDARLFKLASKLEAFLYRRADVITGQSDGIIDDIRRRFPGLRVEKVSNGVDVTRFDPPYRGQLTQQRAALGLNGELGVVYTGLHGAAQGLEQVLNCASLLQGNKVRFVLVGDGPVKPNLQELASAMDLENVDFLKPITRHEIPRLLKAMDVALVTLKKPLLGAVPSKLYEAMAAGKPVVFVGGGEGADIVERHQAGLTVPPDDPDALAKSILTLLGRPELREYYGKNGRAAVHEHFNRDVIADRLHHLLHKLLCSNAY